jgi:ammonium transporter, Amt family
LTGLFAQKSIAGSDGSAPILGGFLDHNYKQLGIQLADSVTGFTYSFIVTVSPTSLSRRTALIALIIPVCQTMILWAMHVVPWFRLRTTEEAEIIGIDDAEMGEFAYDYVGIENEIGHNPHEELHTLSGERETEKHQIDGATWEVMTA